MFSLPKLMKEFTKKYDHKSTQKNISELRKSIKEKPLEWDKYNLIASPVSIAGDLHLWQVSSLILQDSIVKYQRLKWNNIDWKTWLHHSSFLSHVLFDQELKARKIKQDKLSDKEYSNLFWQELHNQKEILETQIKSLGLGYSDFNFTLDENLGNDIRKIFKQLFDKEKILYDMHMSYWHKWYQTVLGETDVEHVTKKWKKYFVRYFVDTKKHSLVVWTTRPDTIFGDVALAVNPLDKRYKKFVGKKVIIPIINKTIPIVVDDAVDMTVDQWVYKVAPAHDKLSLEIAKRQNLPLDKYAIDFEWKFTEHAGMFAGKDAKEFFDNIIQYLDDISNLESRENCEYTVALCRRTQDELEYMSTHQWFLTLDEEYDKIISILEEDDKLLKNFNIEIFKESVSNYSKRCISRQNKFGHLVPVYKTKGWLVVLEQEQLLSKYQETKSKDKLLLSLIVFNLILDGYLTKDFDVEDLINILLSFSFKDKSKNVIQVYLDMYADIELLKKEIQEVNKILTSVEDIKNMEEIGRIVDMLDESFLINSHEETYIFDFETLVWDKWELEDSILNSGLVSSLWSTNFDLNNINMLQSSGNDLYSWILRCRATNLALDDKFDVNKIYLNNLLVDKKNKQMCLSYDNIISYNDLIVKNPVDTIRMALAVNQWDKDYIFQKDSLETYNSFLNKLWNASRFIKLTLIWEDNLDLDNLKSDVSNAWEAVTPFDAWILYGIQDLIDEMDNDLNKNNIWLFANKLLSFVQDKFCDKYLEIIKQHKKSNTNSIIIYVLSDILKLMSVFAPYITEQIWQLLGFKGNLIEQKLTKLERLPTKNYKIHLFIDIISRLLNIKKDLWLKKHELVDVFVNASADFIHTIWDYQDVLWQIVRANKLDFVRNNQEFDTNWYTVDNVIDIQIWLKQVSQNTKNTYLQDLKTKLEQKKDYIQYLRSIISSASSAGKYDIVHLKNKEMETIKAEVDALEHEIKMLKSK